MPAGVNLRLFDPAELAGLISEDVDALLIRTVTKINPETFPSLPDKLQFIGTGSAGTDHINIPYLEENGIVFANAAGCNARSVAEYVAVSILLWADTLELDITDYSVGIIGAGATGSAVRDLLEKLNIKSVLYDPPRQKREPGFTSATIEQVLSTDILTFHTPLTHSGAYPTYHWLNAEKLDSNEYSLVINASRGGVIDESALMEAKKRGRVGNFVIDVWENEPKFCDAMAREAFIKTPHIAGYSIQAKERASEIIAKALLDHFSLNKNIPDVRPRNANPKTPSRFWSLTDVLTYFHPIRDYETRLMMLIGRQAETKAIGFSRIRTGHPLRNEFRFLEIPTSIITQYPILEQLMDKK